MSGVLVAITNAVGQGHLEQGTSAVPRITVPSRALGVFVADSLEPVWAGPGPGS